MNKMCLPLTLILCMVIISNQQICATSQFYNGQRCSPCKANCICTSQWGCDTCISGYTFDQTFQYCLQCPRSTDSTNVGCSQCCNQIQGTAFLCSSCPNLSDTFLVSGQCIRLLGCTTILPTGRCQACRIGFYMQNGACIQCDSSCSSCSDINYCHSCAVGYFSISNADYAVCSACSTGCSQCTSSSACTACVSGFRLAGSSCASCTSHCSQCSASGCSACVNGATLVGTSCIACSDTGNGGSNGCSSCNTQNSAIICTFCGNGYFLNSNSACQPCLNIHPNSKLCTTTSLLQCKDDYHAILANRFHKVENVCVPNINNCKKIADKAGSCSECYFQPGKYYRLSNGVCIQCIQTGCSTFNQNTCACLSCLNEYQFVNSQCIACQNQHCYICQQSVTSCQQCAPYYGLISSACISCIQAVCLNCDGDTSLCNTCLGGYYNSEGICFKCQSTCLTCISSTQCTQCQTNHYLNQNGRCKRLPSNCVTVDAYGICEKCQYGYQKLYGFCFPCSPTMFNMQKCEKFCPSYYALTFENNTTTFILLVLVLISFIMI